MANRDGNDGSYGDASRETATGETARMETARMETARLRALDALDRGQSATLVVLGRHGTEAVRLSAGAELVLGRGEDASLCVPDASLSRAHARFTLTKQGVEVEDLGSRNGTRIAGVAVDRRVLVVGEEVQLGAVTVVVLGSHGLPWLLSHEGLRAAAADERQRARLFSRPFSIAVVRTPGPAARALFDGLVALRAVDRCALLGERELEVLLPEADADTAARIVGLVVQGQPNAQAAVAAYPEHGLDPSALFAAARFALGAPGAVGRARADAALTAATGAEPSSDTLASDAPAMRTVLSQLERAARTPVPLLFVGETGTGKEVLAQRVHARSGRKGPLVAVNCGAIPLSLVESTLFGHDKGAFTGAASDKAGLFEAGDGGSVFLDEVGELPASAQTALLRVLETRRVTRVGGTREIAVDVRLIAATHRDLDEMVKAGAFRQDLLFRINTMTLAVPPLRERREDIVALAERFLREAAKAHGRAVRGMTDDARELLLAHPWPGNVRELKNAMERAVVFAAELVDVDELPDTLRARTATAPVPPAGQPVTSPSESPSLGAQVDAFERTVILDALKHVGGSVADAATALQIPKRTLQYKMKALGLTRAVDYKSPT